jgi:hypothetical protein
MTKAGKRLIASAKQARKALRGYNDGYTHEALHTTFVLMETFSDHVIDTRCADEFADVKAAADKAHQAMFDLYQLIGTKFKED